MLICPTKTECRGAVATFRATGKTVALVPTMGFLHGGHMALVRAAQQECAKVVASVFVNPTQFGPNEDLATYPRDEARDLDMLRAAGVDAVFLPTPTEMYHRDAQTVVETQKLSRMLMGRLRPGHFRGVATVVTKLLNIVGPDIAFFGEKDYQQLCVIRTMARDLDLPCEIRGVPTVREADGLAMSSRNVRLTPEDRAAAIVLNQALDHAEAQLATGISAGALKRRLVEFISAEPRAQTTSVDVRDARTLTALRGDIATPAVVLLAVRFSGVLLIDQRVIRP